MSRVRIPFANGTEGEARMARWCDHREHDHAMHEDNPPGCAMVMFGLMPDLLPWPEPWVAAPDYWKHLPARIACLMFKPCDACGGDPGAEQRPEYVASILADLREATA